MGREPIGDSGGGVGEREEGGVGVGREPIGDSEGGVGEDKSDVVRRGAGCIAVSL